MKRKIRRKILSAMLICTMLAGIMQMAGSAISVKAESSLDYVADREERLEKWYRSTRVGAMYHWGMPVGRADMSNQQYENYPYTETEYDEELGALTIPEYDEELANIDVSQWVEQARLTGAGYITFASFHSCLGYIRPWHSDIPGFPETKRDFLQELIDEAHKYDIKVVVYMTTSLNHAQDDVYDWYDGDAYVEYAKEHHSEWIKKKYGRDLSDEEWDTTFNFERSSYGFGAFSFDEVEYLLKNYDIDGMWFDAHCNPTWHAEDAYPWYTFPYDGCRENCTNPEHKQTYTYDAEGFAKYYFYKRDILQLVHDVDPDCVTFVNRYAPYINADVVGVEGHLLANSCDVIQPGYVESGHTEAMLMEGGTFDYSGDDNVTVDEITITRQMVQCALAGGAAALCTGPKIEENGFASTVENFHEKLSEFRKWSAESWYDQSVSVGYNIPDSYTSRQQENGAYVMASKNETTDTHYLHILTKPSDGKTIIMKDLMQPIESISDLHTGQNLEYERKNGKLYITVTDWKDYETYGDTIIKIQDGDPTIKNITEILEKTLTGSSVEVNSNYRMVFPKLPDGYSAKLSFTSDEDIIGLSGIVNQTKEAQNVTLRFRVTDPDGKTSETSDISMRVEAYRNTKNRISQTDIEVTASSTQSGDSPGGASSVLDGDPDTFWHSQYAPASPLPQHLVLDLGKVRSVIQLDELPRQGMSNGLLLNYELYGSIDGSSYSLVKKGTFEASNNEQSIILDSPVDARYLKLVATESSSGKEFVSIAEINIWEEEYVTMFPKEIVQEKLQELVQQAESEFYQFFPEDQQEILKTVENARNVQSNQNASFEDIVLAVEAMQGIIFAERKEGTYNVEMDFEDEETLTSFENYTKNEGGSPGKGQLTSGGSAVSGAQSMEVFNDRNTAWSNGVITKAPLAVNAADGIVFRLKVSAGNAVKPMLHVNDIYDGTNNKDLLSGFTLMDAQGQMVTEGYTYDSSWGKVTFNSDFDGYMFIPYTEKGIKGFSEIKEDDDVYLAFHFEHMPSYAPEFIIDDVGTYFGTDLAAVLADLNAQRSEHAVKVTNGNADKAKAMTGELITVTADKAPEGSVFRNWENTGIFLNDEQKKSENLTFIMPASDVELKAVYAENNNTGDTDSEGSGTADADSDNKEDNQTHVKGENTKIPNTSDNACVIGIVAVMMVCLGVIGVYFRKTCKRKK